MGNTVSDEKSGSSMLVGGKAVMDMSRMQPQIEPQIQEQEEDEEDEYFDWAAEHAEELRVTNLKLADVNVENYWKQFELNSRGVLELPAAQRSVEKVIQLPGLFETREVVRWAFDRAKVQKKADTSVGDNVVSRQEFPYLIKFLREYANFWFLFHRINNQRNARMRKEKFMRNCSLLVMRGMDIKNPKQVYNQMDVDKKGFIYFHEMYEYALSKNVDFSEV